ncbi:MAG: copper chaperone [Elusimicrobia bacterium]|nr:MAG: copper chaperone [Elusimicrobiota bacterium]KAF0156482.1 MAG: copper chaperone [Elusimicrobiota bacterium]
MKTVIKISGMTCGGCAAGAKKAAESVPGVNSAEVSLERAEAELRYDGKAETLEDVKKALGRAGFTAG